ncbi:MAG TPA: PQQ-binding-like beta-propeller repeat protein [Anaerohalosphaeraceae bacterium]|nr:PQQ-binding-like beta-propeller repeat protein [Anaerohalosphaeraceae bacterium]
MTIFGVWKSRRLLLTGTFVLFWMTAAGVRAESAEPLISPRLLSETGLKSSWQIQLPVKTGVSEKVERVFVLDSYLIVLTNRNYLFCRNRQDGTECFQMQVAEERLPMVEPLFLDNRLYFLFGSRLVVLDPAGGTVVRKQDLGEAAAGRGVCLAKNDRFMYVAGVDRRVHAYQLQKDGDYVKLFSATAEDDSIITSVLATNEQVFFAAAGGAVTAMKTDEPVKLWQYNCSGAITAALVLDSGAIYAGGEDTKLYKINAATGRLMWSMPFFAGEKIRQPPIVGQRLVYLNAGRNGLYGVSKDSGREVWNVPNGQLLLCESQERAYVFAQPGLIVVMNNTTGRPLFSLNAAAVRLGAVNLKDNQIYLADEEGRVVCLSAP